MNFLDRKIVINYTRMTEQEFSVAARKRGLGDENIRSAIDNHYLIKKEMPNIELDEMIIDCALKTQEKTDNETGDFITLD
jgi:hypothetical protein